ncbi:hypothetical protein BHM03_00053147, partial [Ensete ventricosum]
MRWCRRHPARSRFQPLPYPCTLLKENLWCLPSRRGLPQRLLSRHCRFRPVCASSPVVVSAQRWSSVRWEEPSDPALEVGCWRGGARVGKKCFSLGRSLYPARRAFVPETLILLISYHTVAPHHVVRGPCGEARAVLPATRGWDLVERANSGTNPEDLAERVNSGTNLGDLAERGLVGMTSSDSSSSVRIISSPGSGGVSLGDLEASPSGASSGPSSPVDARALRDLEVMKTDHDLDTAVTEGSLAVIRERYNIPVEYELHVPQPGQRPYSSNAPDMCILVDALEAGLRFPLHPLIEECLRWWRISPSQVAPTHHMDLDNLRGMPKVSGGKASLVRTTAPAWEVGVSPAREAPKASSKRPIDAPIEQVDDPARRPKKVKVLTRRHKSRHGEGGSRSHSKGKEPVAPAEEPESPVEFDEGDASLVHHRPRSMKDLF